MKRLLYTLVINLPDSWEPNQELSFPYVPAIEGKTIVAVETYNFSSGGANPAINGQLLLTTADASNIFVNFSNAENLLIIQDYPYSAFINTDVLDINGNQSRAIKQPFAFVFSSKFSYVINKDSVPIAAPAYALQFRFTYLEK
jgi:hypothetical protein